MADWEFPGLGFDPLPGNPRVVTDLEHDARIFGQRMTEQATELRKLAWRDGWQGEAAEVFSQHLKTLPLDLERCGEAFTGLADALTSYASAFDVAKRTTVADMERRAVETRQKMQAADTVFHTPVISAPGDCPPPPDHKPLDDAQDELGAILREAHGFADRFNDSAEVQHLEHTIRHALTHYAPDEPGWNIIKRWAGDVFKATPVGAAIDATHELINHYAEFFSDLATLLSDLSGTIGILSLPLMFVPGIAPAVAVAALATAAASTTIKASLYVGKARDAEGHLYVSGGQLLRSAGDTAFAAAGIGVAAKATQAASALGGTELSFSKSLAAQFSKETLAGAKVPVETIQEFGAKEGIRRLAARSASEWAMKGNPELAYTIGGAAIGIYAPMTTSDVSNVAGWKAPVHLLGPDLLNFFRDEAKKHIEMAPGPRPPAGPLSDQSVRPVMKTPIPRNFLNHGDWT